MAQDWNDRDRDWRDDRRRGAWRRDRDWTERAGDEVRSWFGDEEAEYRRRQDDPERGRDYGGYGFGYGGPHRPGRSGERTWRDERNWQEDRWRDDRPSAARAPFETGGTQWGSSPYGAYPYGYVGRPYEETMRGRDPYRSPDWDRGQGGYRDHRRDWTDRAGDEVRSWFGDEDAERRRRQDAREDDAQHRGRGPKGYSRSDERVREDISDRLTDDPYVDASEIEIQVSGGEVTLSGSVTQRSDKRRAEDLAEAVSGVRHVQNNLRVRSSGETTASGTKPVAPEYTNEPTGGVRAVRR